MQTTGNWEMNFPASPLEFDVNDSMDIVENGTSYCLREEILNAQRKVVPAVTKIGATGIAFAPTSRSES
jgi:hypothetical protein